MDTLSKVIESAFPDLPELDPIEQQAVRQRCVIGARSHLAKAPAQVQLAFHSLFLLFVSYCLLTDLRWIGAIERERRSLLLSRFSATLPPSFSAFERLVRSVALLAYYEDSDVRQALGYPSLEQVRDNRRRARAGRS
jgi:hypothetical protein